MFDTAIIGTGPAGFSAAINLKLHEKKIIWFGSKQFSDKVQKSEKIANYPGMGYITGPELNRRFDAHVKEMGLTIEDKMVTNIMPMKDRFMLLAENEMYEAKSLLLATGVVSAKGFEGEKELLGMGVSYCATCDGMLYRNKDIIVVGRGREAPAEANYLQSIGCRVTYAANKRPGELNADIPFVQGARLEVRGEQTVTALAVDGTEYPCAGIFILRDAVAPTDLLPELETEKGVIRVDRAMATNIPGVFAAGDCTGVPIQIAKAVGEGHIAALSACEFIDKQN